MENDTLNENISRILNDPEGMEKLQAVARSIFGESAPETPPSNDINVLMKAASALKGGETDERGRLLLALKPHLKAERQERVDRAVRLLRLAKLAPLLKDMDLF